MTGPLEYSAAPSRISCFDVPVPAPLTLPAGLSERPLQMADARAVTELMAAQEAHDIGTVSIEEADILGDWGRPSYDVSAGTVGVLDGDRLVAYAEMMGADRGDAAVHPDYRGRGIGTALAGWMQARAREAGSSVIGMPVPQGSAGDRLLAALGYHVRWESWTLELPADAQIPPRDLPPGYAIREATPADHEACWTVIEDAFLEWSERDRTPLDDWLATVVGRPGFEPWNLRVATDPAGTVVGATQVFLSSDQGYVNKIATRRDQRGRGIAQAMLVDAFAAARDHGATGSGLDTDSRTGALGLYEAVGMVVSSTWVNRAIQV
jgi:mycothiol synthase